MSNIDEVQIYQVGPMYIFTCPFMGKFEYLTNTLGIDGKPWDSFTDCPDEGCFIVELNPADITEDRRNEAGFMRELQIIWSKLHEMNLVKSAEMPTIIKGFPVKELATSA